MSQYLPPEIITLILKRLPAESAVRCTAVCKAWYALIKHPSFISTHLQEGALCDDLILFQVVGNQRDTFHLRRDNDSLEDYKQLHSPFKHEYGCFRTVGTCDGLICLAKLYSGYWYVVLWNPSIQKHFILPKPDLYSKKGFSSTLGFGFDSVSNDYKVLLTACRCDDDNISKVWLFSLNRRSWMSLSEAYPKHSCCRCSHKALFVKGVLHWLSYDGKNALISNMILAFDLSTEKFHVMNCPETLFHYEDYMTLIKYEESIALIASNTFKDSYYKPRELWVMKEYGVNSSWTKVLHWIDGNEELIFDSGMTDVVGVRKNGKLLLKVQEFCKDEYELATLDLNCYQQQQRLMPVVGMRVKYEDSIFMGFVESLVLLDKGEEDPVGQNGDPLADQDVPESSNARVLDPSQPNKPPQGHSSSLALVAGPKSGSDRVPNPWQQRGSHAPSFAQVLARNVVKT